jgi:hypothetical protein
VIGFYTPQFRDLFFKPDPPHHIFRAVVTVLCGRWNASLCTRAAESVVLRAGGAAEEDRAGAVAVSAGCDGGVSVVERRRPAGWLGAVSAPLPRRRRDAAPGSGRRDGARPAGGTPALRCYRDE